MKNKKGVGKRILLIALIVILAAVAADICIKETGARRIPQRYASADEGKELLLANTEYYSLFSQKDMDYRVKKEGATMEELLQTTTDEIRNFNLLEKYLMDRRIAKMARKLKKNGYVLPKLETITYIKTDMSVEGSQSGYTHGNEIYPQTSCSVSFRVPASILTIFYGMSCSTASRETIRISGRRCIP